MDEDLELLARTRDGDAGAFERLVRKYEKPVHNLVYRFTGGAGDVDDLAQEVFLRVYRSASSFEAQSKFFTWLYRITLNVCLKERDKLKRRPTTSLDEKRNPDEGPARELEDPAGSAEDAFARREMARIVKDAIMQLPEDQRTAVILHKYENLQYEEIAEVLQLSLPAVKSRLHRAKLALKEILKPHIKNP